MKLDLGIAERLALSLYLHVVTGLISTEAH